MKLPLLRVLQSLGAWPGRPRAVLLLCLCVMLGGCISSTEPLLSDSRAAPPGLEAANFLKACKEGVCLVYWKNRRPGGEMIGGQLIYRDFAFKSFEPLDGGQHWIAQSSTRDRVHHSYALLRKEGDVWLGYDFDPKRINRDYLERLAAAGAVTVTESTNLFGLARDVRINHRAGLLRWMQDMARLSQAELASVATVYTVSAASPEEVKSFMDDRASDSSRSTLLSPHARFERPPLVATAGGCPSDLPANLTCTRYDSLPPDPVHPIGPIEVLYFQRWDCVHCERMKNAVARWQLQLPQAVGFVRANANWLPKESPGASLAAYRLTRVPALVVNRRYRIELAASDEQTVQRALDLALHLAGEFKR